MLLSFRFANHRSFHTEQQLNLTPVYRPSEDIGDTAVPVVGIFGANASGKSNSLHALSFMRLLAVRSDREVEPGLGLARHPFRLDRAALSEPSRYVVDLSLAGIRHTYGFTINDEKVLEEWLYCYPLRKRRKVFERDQSDFSWGEESGARGELQKIADITAPTALFLSTTARFDQRQPKIGPPIGDPMHDVYRWFFRLRSHLRGGPQGRSAQLWPESEDSRGVVTALLRAADIGITDVRLKTPIQDGLFPTEIDFDTDRPEQFISQRASGGALRRREQRGRQRLEFSHRGPHGDVVFEISDESSGTQQLLDLSIDAAISLRINGTMMVDEIDASLHPMLTAKLILLFQSPTTNPLRSQLIFTSHDAALLGTFDAEEVLHRDQIWFTEKDKIGASTLYPLSDFKPRREGENRQRRYLNGNYGGVPDLSSDVFEQALVARGEFDAAAEEA